MRRTHSYLALLLLSCLLISACSLLNPADPDQVALDSLGKAGSDLSKPHPFGFYLYHKEVFAARQMCDQLLTEGYRTNVSEGAGKGEWLCLASVDFVPSFDTLSEIQDRMAIVAKQYGGEYDGWETVVVP